MTLTIGLMSGTSLDGVDGVLVRWSGDKAFHLLAHAFAPMPADLRAALLALNTSGPDELHRAALAANRLMQVCAGVVGDLLATAGAAASEVAAIGVHGQTVRHRPGEFDGIGYTLQLVNGALLAELTGIDTICDFRSADVAAGGQGAPLVPAFHAACFARPGENVAVLNLGGIANLSLLGADGSVLGFDSGPANLLLDAWVQQHRQQPFDAGGQWASSGHVVPELLSALLADPFFDQPPPKSTGRDRFNAAWLQKLLACSAVAPAPVDVMATLAELTARTAADALGRWGAGSRELIVCGGGSRNRHLMARLATLLPGVVVRDSDNAGLPADQVEATAFAWLAWAYLSRTPGSLPAVTGARSARVLGALYPAIRKVGSD